MEVIDCLRTSFPHDKLRRDHVARRRAVQLSGGMSYGKRKNIFYEDSMYSYLLPSF